MRLVFAAAALLILLSGCLSVGAFNFAVQAERKAAAEANELIEFARFQTATEREMSAFRGYLLTGDVRYLRQMERARARLLTLLERLSRTAPNPERSQLAALSRDEQAHHRAAEDAIGVRQSAAAPAAVAEMFLGAAEPTRATLEGDISAFLDQKRADAKTAERESNRRIAVSVVAIVGIQIVTLLLMLSLFRFLGREVGGLFELERTGRLRAEEAAAALAESQERERAARNTAEIAERRSAFLAEASEELSSSLDFETTLSNVARLAVPAVADWCFVDVLREGQPERLAVAHRDPARAPLADELRRRHLLDPNAPAGPPRVVRTGQPELIADVTDATLQAIARSPEDYESLRSLGIRSAMSVPLRSRGRVIGVITFVAAESCRRFAPEDLRVGEDLARRASLAIENARLYGESREAIQAREEFLSIASHELMTPITTLQLQIQSVARRAIGGAEGFGPEKLAARLRVAEQQTVRLTRLVENLLDISRIASSSLELNLERIDLADVVRDAVTRFSEELAHARCAIEISVEGPTDGIWDRMRLDQIVNNLLSNAVKYGAGRPLGIELKSDAETASLSVRDQGIGILPEHQARIFGRFERAVSERHYGGLGLGLWIVRQIVDALGGTIRVASEPGRGSTFVVDLPRAGPPRPFVAETRMRSEASR